MEIQVNNCKGIVSSTILRLLAFQKARRMNRPSKLPPRISIFSKPLELKFQIKTSIAHRIPTRIATSGAQPIVCKFTRVVKEQVMNAQNEVCKVLANSTRLRSSCSLENVRLFDHLTLTFSYRQQFVQINQSCSSMQTIKCGVPQGSILGPLFFILCINDLSKVSKLTELLLFADDTRMFFSHSNPNYLENVLNDELLK